MRQLLVWNVDYSLLPKIYTAPFEALWTMDSVGFMWHNATWLIAMKKENGSGRWREHEQGLRPVHFCGAETEVPSTAGFVRRGRLRLEGGVSRTTRLPIACRRRLRVSASSGSLIT